MEKARTFLAFGFGCFTALMLGFGPVTSIVTAGEPEILESRLNKLEARAAELEQIAAGSQVGSKVVAPFDVVDRAKGRIFSVQPDGSVILYYAKKVEAEIAADVEGGNFQTSSASGGLEAALGAEKRGSDWGLSVSDNHTDRISLGRITAGTHHLMFLSGAGQQIAGIGESIKAHSGLALVCDKSGNQKARMGVSTEGKGIVEVLGANQVPIAQITESEHGGGKLWIGNAGGVPMVDAGDAGGFGIVHVGPNEFKFIPTPGLALPGTAIVGKQ